jgi:RNA polymerase sigma factor (TIGR02999 family)
MDTPPGEVTTLLHAWSEGDRSIEDRLFELVMPELHQIAERLMRRERPEHSLDPTALVNEVYVRLVRARERDWESRRHFFALAARAMRRLLIDHARGRPQAQMVPIAGMEDWLRATGAKLEQALAIDGLLNQIEPEHPEWCSIVDLKFFMGLTDEETADALGMPIRTVQRKFGDARRWLFERLESPDGRR